MKLILFAGCSISFFLVAEKVIESSITSPHKAFGKIVNKMLKLNIKHDFKVKTRFSHGVDIFLKPLLAKSLII